MLLLKMILACCLLTKPVIKVVITTDNRPEDKSADSLFYQPARKLQWEDFRAVAPAHPRSGAVSYTSFAYEGGSLRKKDTLFINLTLQAFFVKSASWVTAGVMDSYALAHEQLHFDITYLVALRFREKILNMELSADDYDSMIQYEYIESFREMNKLQEAYDNETNSGRNTVAQYRWQRAIADSLHLLPTRP